MHVMPQVLAGQLPLGVMHALIPGHNRSTMERDVRRAYWSRTERVLDMRSLFDWLWEQGYTNRNLQCFSGGKPEHTCWLTKKGAEAYWAAGGLFFPAGPEYEERAKAYIAAHGEESQAEARRAVAA